MYLESPMYHELVEYERPRDEGDVNVETRLAPRGRRRELSIRRKPESSRPKSVTALSLLELDHTEDIDDVIRGASHRRKRRRRFVKDHVALSSRDKLWQSSSESSSRESSADGTDANGKKEDQPPPIEDR